MHKSRHIALGKTLAEIGEGLGRRPVLAISDAGAVPYYSKWHVIDTRGLNNAHIARSGGHDPEYVLSQSPDLVVIVSRRVNPVVPIVPWQDDLYQACLSAGLQVIRSYGNLPYVQVVMGKAESEIARRLRQ
jgi:hypothetical protein